MRLRLPARAVAILIVVLLVSASALAQSPEVPGQHNEVPEGTTEDAHQIHAEAYAEDRGVDIDEAKRRLELQAAVMDLSAQLMTHERDVMANIRIEHEPNFHVIIFVIPGGKERVIPYLKDGPLADITTFEMVEYTQDQLVADLERANELLRPLEVLYSAVVTEREVQIFVEDAEALQKRLNEEKIELPATVKVHEVEILGPETDGTVIGGFAVSTPGNCTSGFAGRFDGVEPPVKGIFTAGHCGQLSTNPLRFDHIPGVDFPLYDQFVGGSSDFQLHVHQPAHVLRSMINVGTTWLPITGLYWRVSMTQGAHVCKFGRATQNTCGYIWSQTYQPLNVTLSGITRTFSPTFIWVKNKPPAQVQNPTGSEPSGTNLSSGGDSGAPWYGALLSTRNSAFGINYGSVLGGRDAIFMAQDYLVSRNYRIYVNCPTVGGIDYKCN